MLERTLRLVLKASTAVATLCAGLCYSGHLLPSNFGGANVTSVSATDATITPPIDCAEKEEIRVFASFVFIYLLSFFAFFFFHLAPPTLTMRMTALAVALIGRPCRSGSRRIVGRMGGNAAGTLPALSTTSTIDIATAQGVAGLMSLLRKPCRAAFSVKSAGFR
jgi:hypothetical protein